MFTLPADDHKPKNVSEKTWKAMNALKILDLPEDWTDEQCMEYLNQECLKRYKRKYY